MFKQALVCAALATVVAIGTPDARPSDHSRTSSVVELADAQHTATVMPVLLRDIVTWLSLNFDLPATERLPNIAFTSPAGMTALRYRGLLSHHDQRDAGSDIVAVYDSATETIHLPDGWRGATPAELSVLVHEVSSTTFNIARGFPTLARKSARSLPTRRRIAGCIGSSAHCSANSAPMDSRCSFAPTADFDRAIDLVVRTERPPHAPRRQHPSDVLGDEKPRAVLVVALRQKIVVLG